MSTITFYYYEDCPSHERALALLKQVVAEEGVEMPIEVVEVKTEEEARASAFYGSPTIRVDGVDIAPVPEELAQPALTCRAYRRADGRISPLPSRELIVEAVRKRVGTR